MSTADGNNPWIQQARAARFRWPGWLAAIGAAVFSVAVLELFKTYGVVLEIAVTGAVKDFPGVWATSLAYGALQGLVFGCFFAAALLLLAIQGRTLWGGAAGRPLSLALGLAIGAGGICASVAIAAAAGAITDGPGTPTPLNLLAFGLLMVAFQSLAEEAFFRGWLQPILCSAWGAWVGVIITAALFALLHWIAGAQSPMAIANVFLGGLLFGFLALRTGNLFAAAGAHFAWNWTEADVLGLSQDPTGSLLHLGFKGSPLWNGGVDTMNGSLATVIVLVILAGGAAWALARGRSGVS